MSLLFLWRLFFSYTPECSVKNFFCDGGIIKFILGKFKVFNLPANSFIRCVVIEHQSAGRWQQVDNRIIITCFNSQGCPDKFV